MLLTGGRVVAFGDIEIPAGATWLDCSLLLQGDAELTVNGIVQNCLISVDGPTFRLTGTGEFNHNYVKRAEDES